VIDDSNTAGNLHIPSLRCEKVAVDRAEAILASADPDTLGELESQYAEAGAVHCECEITYIWLGKRGSCNRSSEENPDYYEVLVPVCCMLD
jgi:hypothetical protein